MHRKHNYQALNQSNWDVIIIGGGATGLGTALDSASRGYKTLLVEQSDFAKGIVLSIPIGTDSTIKVGDTIVYPKKFAKDFDLFKDSQLVKPYDVVAKVVK